MDKKDQKDHRDRKNPRSAELHRERKKEGNSKRPKQIWVADTMPDNDMIAVVPGHWENR